MFNCIRSAFVLAILATFVNSSAFAGVRVEEIRTPAGADTPPAPTVPRTFKVTIFGGPEKLAKTMDGTPTGTPTQAFVILEEATLDPETILPVGQEIPVELLPTIPAPLPNRLLQVQTILSGTAKAPARMKFEPDTTFVAGATMVLGFNPITSKSFIPASHVLVTGTRLSGYTTQINAEQGLAETVAAARRLRAIETRPAIHPEELQQIKDDLRELKNARTGVLVAATRANAAAESARTATTAANIAAVKAENAAKDANAATMAATAAANRANSAAEKAEKLIQKFTVEYEYSTDCNTHRPIRRKVGTTDWEFVN